MQQEDNKEADAVAVEDYDSKHANDQHNETMKRLKALTANDDTREIRLGDPNKEILGVDTKKKLQSPRRTVPKTYPDESTLISKFSPTFSHALLVWNSFFCGVGS
ncbi:hypothetical protein LSTR_LSTR016685 [Laodelphax striatellus]|uniref:Uncharacterized protein n=1 Tax=Laodelphax striatellus TaxID=195883 RepID=A0A482XLK2_LAOST|nr:hypothetical protein LSTR_LSTR016685 [Laodelphax striatellus]